jgi:hypothetical protein
LFKRNKRPISGLLTDAPLLRPAHPLLESIDIACIQTQERIADRESPSSVAELAPERTF